MAPWPYPIPTTVAPEGFELVLDLVEEASAGLLAHIKQQDLQ